MATKLVANTKVKLKIVNALSRGKAFVLFLEGEDTPVILARRNAAEDGYIHRTQLIGVTGDFTPTQATNGGQPGWLASIELPLAQMSTNPLLQNRQAVADRYAMANLYAIPTSEEV